MQLPGKVKEAFYRACGTIRLQFWLSPVGAVSYGDLFFKENGYILLRPILALIALGAFTVGMTLPGKTQASAVQQEPKPETKQETKQEKHEKQQEPKTDSKGETKFTAEQVAESVILVYGSRPALEQIRRDGVE